MTHIIQYLSKSVKISPFILALMTFISFIPTQELAAEDGDYLTDIILINGQPELVDFNKDGDVLQRHVSVPDYFTSGRSHKRSLRKSLSKLKVYGAVETPSPVFYHAPVECRQSVMSVKEENVILDKAWSTVTYDNQIESSIEPRSQGSTLSIISDMENKFDTQTLSVELGEQRRLFFVHPKQRLEHVARYWKVSEEQLLI